MSQRILLADFLKRYLMFAQVSRRAPLHIVFHRDVEGRADSPVKVYSLIDRSGKLEAWYNYDATPPSCKDLHIARTSRNPSEDRKWPITNSCWIEGVFLGLNSNATPLSSSRFVPVLLVRT